MANLDPESCFAKLAYFQDSADTAGDWDVLVSDRLTISTRSRGGSCQLKLENRSIPTSPEYYAMLYHAEFMAAEPLARWPFMETSLLHLIHPGDAIVSIRFGGLSGGVADRVLRLVGLASRSVDGHKVRTIVRRDFPKAGVWAFCSIPLHARDDSLLELEPAGSVYFHTVQGVGGEPERCVHIAYWDWPWPAPSPWMAPLFGPLMLLHTAWLEKHAELPLAEAVRLFYTVVSLQSCSRGLPLLPSPTSPEGDAEGVWLQGYWWSPCDPSTFTMPDFLGDFTCRMGLRVRTFDRLDGHILAPFQAAVLGPDWAAADARFQELWRIQRSAYRLLRGGKASPKIRFGADPRFVSKAKHDAGPNLSTVNTFVDVDAGVPVALRPGLQPVWDGLPAEC